MGIGERRSAARIRTVEDARRFARRRVPPVVFDYLDGAAEAEVTMGANRAAIAAVEFRPKMAATPPGLAPDLSTTVLGSPLALPVLLSPVGFTRMMEPGGDVAGARAAGRARTVFTASSVSGHTLEAVAAAATGPVWFQLYALGGRAGAERMIERARKAGYGALVVTVDTQIPGNRERDLRHGIGLPLRLDARTALRFGPQTLAHPRWLADFARDDFSVHLANAAALGPDGGPVTDEEALLEWILSPIVWEDFGWIGEQWHGPVVAKGVVTGEDARRALDAGAAAIVVSNHGGRQLDGLPGSFRSLVEVLEAVGGEVEVLVDGGVRRGSDVVRAVGLGARAAMVGRAWAFGLAAAGEPGVDRVLSILRADIDRTLRLLGCPSVAELDRRFVPVPAVW